MSTSVWENFREQSSREDGGERGNIITKALPNAMVKDTIKIM